MSTSTVTYQNQLLQRKGVSRIAIIVLVLFHQIGLIGLHLEATRDLFQQLVPMNLLLSITVLLLFHRPWTTRFVIFCFVIFWAGYLVELLGITTQVIFGPYHYDTALGFKVAGVPPMIGINWLMLVYCSGMMFRGFKLNIWLRSLLAALAMVLLDMVIEPMAIRYDFWTWDTIDGHIPAQNFLAWFVVSFGMCYAFQAQPDEKQNPVAVPLFLIQFFFFFSFWVIDKAALG